MKKLFWSENKTARKIDFDVEKVGIFLRSFEGISVGDFSVIYNYFISAYF